MADATSIDKFNMKPELREEFERIVAKMGGIEAMHKGMEEFHAACVRLNNEREAMTKQYPNKWVGINREGRLFVGDTLEDLLSEFEAQGVDDDGYAIKYLDPNPEILLL